MNVKRTRRGILKAATTIGAAAALPQVIVSAARAQNPKHERYGDFLVLPSADMPLPLDVVLNGALPVLEGSTSNVRGRRVASAAEAQRDTGFPLYTIAPTPGDIRFAGTVEVVRNRAGQIVLAAVPYETWSSAPGAWLRTIDLTVTEVFLRPFPVWPTTVDGVTRPPVKVLGLPGPGILSRTALGHVVHWIHDRRLYQLRVENGASQEQALAVAASLTAV